MAISRPYPRPWTWVYSKSDGSKVRLDKEEFASQGDAETWLGENWSGLVAQGAQFADLCEQGVPRITYSLPLSPEDL